MNLLIYLDVVRRRGGVVLTAVACMVLPLWIGCGASGPEPPVTGSDGAGVAAPVTLTDQELAMARTLSPLPTSPPPNTTNRVADDSRAAAFGQRLFFERGFSGILAVGDDGTNGGLGPVGAAGRVACASCHGGPALDDRRSRSGNVSLGADFLARNSPPLVNSSDYTIGLAQSGPHAPPSDTGRFADVTVLSASVFNTSGAFSDDTTTGRLDGLVSPPPADTTGQFRTPSLRNVAVTAPYMHAGQLATLTNVVDFYDEAGSRIPAVGTLDPLLSSLNLTPQQKADLVAFMEALTSASVDPALLVDTSAP